MKLLAVLPFVTAYQVLETSNTMDVAAGHTYDGMKATLKGISEMQRQNPGTPLTASVIKQVRDLLEQIEGQMMEGLKCDVNETQSMLNTAEKNIKKCDDNRKNWFDNTYVNLNTNVSNAKTAHEKCREGDGAIGDGSEADHCTNATADCDAYRERIHNWIDCDRPENARFETTDAARVEAGNDDIFEYLCCLEEFFKEQVPKAGEGRSFFDDRTRCDESYDAWCDKIEECDDKQEAFELKFCEREKKVENECKTYRECRNKAQKTYGKILENVKEAEEIYRAQRVALDCLICYGNMILNNDTDLTECDAVRECTELSECPTIDYPTIEKCTKCEEPNKRVPCTPNFIDDHYVVFEGSCTPPQQCTSCSGLEQTEGDKECEAIPGQEESSGEDEGARSPL